MKKLILLELLLLFLATTFMTDTPPPGWYQQILPRNDVTIQDIFFIDSLVGHVVSRKNTNDSAFIFKTTDGGNNWITTLKEGLYLTSLQFTDANTGYSAGSAPPGILKKTTDGGQNWYTVSTLAAYPLWDIAFINKDTGWTCSDDIFAGGIYKTTNGGINWILQPSPNYRMIKLFFLNKDTGWAGSNDWKLYRTTNGGNNWGLQYTFSNSLRNLFFVSKDTGFISGLFGSSSIFKTTNGGYNWQPTTNSQGTLGLYFVNNRIGYSSAGASVLQKSSDGGDNWFYQTVPSGGYQSLHFIDTLYGWAGGSILIHTADGGGPPAGIRRIGGEIPKDFRLYQNYPNPFNPSTSIKYQIEKSTYIILKVYNIQGKEIGTLVNQKQNAGTYEADFDGSQLPSGVYFYSLVVDGKLIETKKMVLLK